MDSPTPAPMSLTLPDAPPPNWRARLTGLVAALRGHSVEARTRRSALFSIAARIVNAGVLLATHILLARLLGSAEFGLFSLATTWVLTLLGLATLGLTMAPQRFQPEYDESGSRAALAGLYRFAHLAPLLAGIAIAIAGLAVLRFAHLDLSHEARLTIGLAMLALPALAVIDVVEGFALANDWHDLAYGVTFVVKPLLLPMLFLTGWLAGVDDLQGAVTAFVLAAWSAALLLVLCLHARMRPIIDGTAPAYEARRWFRLAMPAMFADGAFLTMAYADVLVLAAYASAAETGVYVAATKLVGVVAFIHFGLSYATAHHFSALHAGARHEELVHYARKAAAWTFWPALGVGLGVVLMAAPVLSLFGKDFVAGAGLVPVLVAALLVRAAIGPSEQLLLMTNRESTVTAVFASAAVVNLLLAFALAPVFGALGVAVAVLAANLFAVMFTAIAVRRAFGGFVHAFHSPFQPAPALIAVPERTTEATR